MATVGNELYLRHLWCLGEGGLLVLRGIVTREAAKCGKPLENTLLMNKAKFRNIMEYQRQTLFPSDSTANKDLETWDMSLLMLVINRLFKKSLLSAEESSIDTIKILRNKIQGHPTSMSMGETDYDTNQKRLEPALKQLASGINAHAATAINDIIKKTKSEIIDIQMSIQHIQKLHEFKTSVLNELESKFREISFQVGSKLIDIKGRVEENTDRMKRIEDRVEELTGTTKRMEDAIKTYMDKDHKIILISTTQDSTSDCLLKRKIFEETRETKEITIGLLKAMKDDLKTMLKRMENDEDTSVLKKQLQDEAVKTTYKVFKGTDHELKAPVDVCIQAKTNTKPHNQPLYTYFRNSQQVVNNAGGYVFRLDDLKRLQRFVIIGIEGGIYYIRERELRRENVFCIDRLIGIGKGMEAVQIIREISVNRRCVKQDSLLLAYAILARCNDKETERAAYAILSEVCRIPTHLFKFIEYCENESRDYGASKPSKHPGWGRAHKRAVSSWYTSFAKEPEQLARLVTKYRKHGEWSHKDVIKLAHTSTDDKAIGFILRYITKGLVKAREMYLDNDADVDTDTRTTIDRIANFFQICDTARRCAKRQHLCSIITENKLSWEQCNSDLLRSKEVWSALLPHMPVEATIRNLGRMTSYGLFADNTEDEELVLNKIRSIKILAETSEGTTNYGGDGKVVKTEASYENTKERRNNILHPFSILLALDTYKKGRGDKGSRSWIPNQKIVQALERAFYQAFETVTPTGKKFYLAVDVNASMSQPVRGCIDLSCSTAAAAMMMLTARTEENHIIKGFSENMVDIDVHEADTVWDVQKKMEDIPFGRSDCSQPIMDALANRIKDVDVFVVYTDNETSLGKVHPCEALRQYRKYSERPNAKLIVCGMCSTEFTIADQDDPNMLDIVGFDPAAPRLIAEFAMDKI